MGNRHLRRALVVLALLCVQALVFAHAFDHPIDVAHIDHACTSCVHGHSPGAPPAQPMAVEAAGLGWIDSFWDTL